MTGATDDARRPVEIMVDTPWTTSGSRGSVHTHPWNFTVVVGTAVDGRWIHRPDANRARARLSPIHKPYYYPYE